MLSSSNLIVQVLYNLGEQDKTHFIDQNQLRV